MNPAQITRLNFEYEKTRGELLAIEFPSINVNENNRSDGDGVEGKEGRAKGVASRRRN